MRLKTTLAASAAICGLSAFPAAAQSEQGQRQSPPFSEASSSESTQPRGLSVITVTAQKRTQSLQDVPVSVNVVGGEALSDRSETQIASLEKFDPSIKFEEGTSDASSGVRVRGVGTQSYSRGVEQSVAVVKDGIVAADTPAALLDFNDVERIEVLRGPQGILFGKNASAGLINIVTASPTDFVTAGADVTYGSNDLLQFSGFVSGPLTDTLSARVSGFRNTMDPLIENGYGPGPDGINDRNEWGVRGKLRFEPSASFDAMLTFDHIERDVSCCGSAGVEYVDGGYAQSVGAPVGEENDLGYLPTPSPSITNYDTVSLEMNLYTGNEGVLTSVTGYQNSINNSSFTSYNTGENTFFVINDGGTDMKQFTQELRYTSPENQTVEYVGGLFYYYREFDRFLNQQLDIGAFSGRDPGAFGLGRNRFVNSTNESVAGFANVTFNVTNAFRLSAGGRLQYDVADVYAENVRSDLGLFDTLIAPAVGERTAERDDTALSWRFAAEYDITPDSLIYASVTRGYKGVGVNALATVVTAPQPIINPEIPTAYELGWKTELLDNRLRLNGSIFRTDFKDFQAQAIVIDPQTEVGTFFLATAGELRTQGLEIQIDAEPVDNFTLSTAVTYLDTEYLDFAGAPCFDGQTPEQGCVGGTQDLTGSGLPGVSDWNFTANARYEVPMDSLGVDAFVLGTFSYRSDFNTTTDPLTAQDAYALTDLFLGFDTQDGSIGVQVFVKNLFNEFYAVGRTTGGRNQTGYNVEQQLAYDYKRRFGVSVNYRY